MDLDDDSGGAWPAKAGYRVQDTAGKSLAHELGARASLPAKPACVTRRFVCATQISSRRRFEEGAQREVDSGAGRWRQRDRWTPGWCGWFIYIRRCAEIEFI